MRAIWKACKQTWYKAVASLSLKMMEVYLADNDRFMYWGNKRIAYMGRCMELL